VGGVMHDFVYELLQLLQTTTASASLVGNLSIYHVVAMAPEPRTPCEGKLSDATTSHWLNGAT